MVFPPITSFTHSTSLSNPRPSSRRTSRLCAYTAPLFLVRVEEVRKLRGCLPECDERPFRRALHDVLALHPLSVDLKMRRTHAQHERLSVLDVDEPLEGPGTGQ